MHYGGENCVIYNVYSFTRFHKLMYNLYLIGSALTTIPLNTQHVTFPLMHVGGESARDFDSNAADSGSDISSDSISDDEDGMDSGSNSDSSGSH